MPIEADLSETTVEPRIRVIRGKRVILDADLAILYGTTTSRLNEQVRRNRLRFPVDFAFPLTREERSEVIANCDHLRKLRYSKTLPLAFTEHGAIMAANVLNTERAVIMSVHVVRAFVRLREMLTANGELAVKLAELERRVGNHDTKIRTLVAAVRALIGPPPGDPAVDPVPRIGFAP